LTQFSAYLGSNITVPYIVAAASGANSTAVDRVKSTNLNVICNNCIFAAVDVAEAALPVIGQVPLASVASMFGVNLADKNATLNSVMNSTCAYKPLAVNTSK
jgi:hypothetical protein